METEILTPDEIESRELFAKIMAEQAAFSNRASAKPTSRPPQTSPALSPPQPPPPLAPPSGFDPAYGLNDLVDVWNLMFPDMDLYPWQAEELLRISGYINGRLNGPRLHFTEQDPYLASYVCANGSGKDKILISTAAIGLPLLYRDVIVVITSSSNEQLKFQTENHITRGIAALNARLGQPVYESIHYYHRCPARGGEIKLFATDEAGRAEGWHPMSKGGRLVIIVNEAKSITPEIFSALDRCHGYSHWLEISSPGPRRGMFYENFKRAIKHPESYTSNRYFARRVDVSLCPHVSAQAQARVVEKHKENSFIVQTSLRANFFEEEKDVVIPAGLVDDCESVEPCDETLGIGLDCAAGGDETSLVVRRGNRLVDQLYFREPDIEKACALIDRRLDPFRFVEYSFNMDDGGVGVGFRSILSRYSWNLIPRHNQSAAYKKDEFANLGAEMWWHVRDLFQSRKIIKPADETLYTQLITRQNDVSEGLGKKKLASKKRIKELGGASPDRADAFVLAFYSYNPAIIDKPELVKPDNLPQYSAADIARLMRRQPNLFIPDTKPQQTGRPTNLIL